MKFSYKVLFLFSMATRKPPTVTRIACCFVLSFKWKYLRIVSEPWTFAKVKLLRKFSYRRDVGLRANIQASII